ncbi:MAG: DUF7345 domain-containing protein [Candidatus Bathyarchaeaceae archaeon]
MKVKLIAAFFFLIFPIFLFAFGIAFCELQLEESRLLEIEVNSDGSATWVITRRYSLKTEDDVEIFQLFLSEFETKKEEYLKTFSDNMRAMVDRASNTTGRNMTAKDFEVDAGILQTPTGSLGVIKYQCIWVGFALVEDTQILIGDVFEAGFFLFENDELTIRYAQGYEVLEVWPSPDVRIDYERTLTWYGPESFGAEEPRVLLEKKAVSIIDVLQAYWAPVGLAALGVSLGVILFYRFNKKRKKEIEKEVPRIIPELESDEDKVVMLLKTMGGRAHQSTIGDKCGFSRSKTSQLLKNMENAGIVRREKRGRERLVVLLQSEKNDKNS